MTDSFTNAFWDIQLRYHDVLATCVDDDEERDSALLVADQGSGTPVDGSPCGRPQLYYLRRPSSSSAAALQLSLQPLPASSGVFSPLGGAAWFGAALLASILEDNNHDPFVTALLESSVRTHNLFRVLELGSGAVGLSGIVLGLQLAHRLGKTTGVAVVLSDNETDVLDQLRSNIAINVERIGKEHPDVAIPDFSVEHLDWGESTATNEDRELDMIIGSELVYTDATARACFGCIYGLLRRNPDCLVILVQTSDRQGWNNVFIPSLQDQQGSLSFRLETRLPRSLYDASSALLRQDVRSEEEDMMCAVYIWNSNSSKFAGFGDLRIDHS